MNSLSHSNYSNPYSFQDFVVNFPFDQMRENQRRVFLQIADAFNSDHKYVILEAPTGCGKSAIAVTTGLTLGTSYILTSTKDLQAQYQRDFPFIRRAIGARNFQCIAIEDLIKSDMYSCNVCSGSSSIRRRSSSKYYLNEGCRHSTVEYGLCHTNEYGFKKSEDPCKYMPGMDDYRIFNKGTREEQIIIPEEVKFKYNREFQEWFHIKRLPVLNHNNSWRPCEYYDQLNQAYLASNSVFSYDMFFAHLGSKNMKPRHLLVLDEGHLFEKEVVDYTSLSIYNKRWKRYILGLDVSNISLNRDDVKEWLPSLIKIETKLLLALGLELKIEENANMRFSAYGYATQEEPRNTKISSFIDYRSDAVTSHRLRSEMYSNGDYYRITSPALRIEAERDLARLSSVINGILSNPKNWILVDDIVDASEAITFKPLNIASYCAPIFDMCSKVLFMSAAILDHQFFCKSIGLSPEEVKFIRVDSDFPVSNRPIHSMRVHHLNYHTIQESEVQAKIAKSIDVLMNAHKNHKGIIHTTSYAQNDFIIKNLSEQNADRLIPTDPSIPREEIVMKHIKSSEPTVLISPSLYMGVDLKDDLSRFQIITKVPYPPLGDKWIKSRKNSFDDGMEGDKWYAWQTALRLVQAYGRSIRSNKDWAITYVLDSNFDVFIKNNAHLLPTWFLSAICFSRLTSQRRLVY